MSPHMRVLRARLPRALVLAAFGLLCSSTIAQAAPNEPSDQKPELACTAGEFCTWPTTDYGGEIKRIDLRDANPEECIPLPDDMEAHSFANRMDRQVTVYQGKDCSTEGDFSTYPGDGSFVPESPYVIRAIQIWN